MTNFEAYKDDLMKINGAIAVDKNTKKIMNCGDSSFKCEDCVFNNSCSTRGKIKWLYEEYKPPVLTDDDVELIKTLGKFINKEYKYIARTKSGKITLFVDKPTALEDVFGRYYSSKSEYFSIFNSDEILFQNIKFGDGIYDIENKCFIKE